MQSQRTGTHPEEKLSEGESKLRRMQTREVKERGTDISTGRKQPGDFRKQNIFQSQRENSKQKRDLCGIRKAILNEY